MVHPYPNRATVRGQAKWVTACITRLGEIAGLLLILLGALGAAKAQTPSKGRDIFHAEGLIPDSPARLRGIQKIPLYREYLPAHVDLSRYFPLPGDQGQQGSCVGWAVGYAARAYYAHRVGGRDVHERRNIPSPAYIYDTIKPPGSCNAGSRISDALDLLKDGAVSLRTFPYSPTECAPPTSFVRAEATGFRIKGYKLVFPAQDAMRLTSDDLDQVKSELYHKNPVIIALHDSIGFSRLRAGEVLYNPIRYRGWHALVVVGYNERLQAFKVINSWGRHWADHGFGWISYDAFRSEVRAAYVMRLKSRVTPSPIPPPTPPAPPAPVSLVLPHLQCSKVALKMRGDKRVIVGFVGHEKDLQKIQKIANGAEVDVQLRPWPQCEALLTLGKAISQVDAPRVSIEAPKYRQQHGSGDLAIEALRGKVLRAGDHLVFKIVTPPFSSYLHVTYFQADGTAVNLMQPGDGSFKAYPPRSKIVIGDASSGGRRFRVSAPFGREMLVVLAARSPIFPVARPLKETQREFLTALRRAFLYKTDPSAPDRHIVAGYDTVITENAIHTNPGTVQ